MIRKITYIVVALLLLIASTGFSVSKHYCHNQLVEIVIDKEAETCCEEGGCCRTETTLVKLDEDLVSITPVVVPDNVINQIVLHAAIRILVSDLVAIEKVEFIEYISPPPPKIQTVLSGLQTYLL